MKRRPKRTYIDCEMDDLIERTRKILSSDAAKLGIKKEFSRIETTKLLAIKYKELQIKRRKETYENSKMWDF